MKRKIVSIVLATAFIISGFSVKTFADVDSNETSLKSLAGITPDNIFYPVDKLLDEVRVILSFSDGSKIEKLIGIAQERLGESQAMAEKSKDKEATEALEEYRTTLEKADFNLDKAVKKNESTKDVKVSEKIAKVEEKLLEEQNLSTKVLEEIKDKLQETKTKEILNTILQMQQEKKEAVRTMVDSRHELNAAKKDYNMAVTELKKLQNSKDTEELKKAEELLKKTEEAYRAAQDEYNEAFESKQTIVKKYAGSKTITTEQVNEGSITQQGSSVVESTSNSANTTENITTQKQSTSQGKSEDALKNKEDKKPAVSENAKEKENKNEAKNETIPGNPVNSQKDKANTNSNTQGKGKTK
jgi:hypothetical protein